MECVLVQKYDLQTVLSGFMNKSLEDLLVYWVNVTDMYSFQKWRVHDVYLFALFQCAVLAMALSVVFIGCMYYFLATR